MNKFRYQVSFRVGHSSMNPDDICQMLKMHAVYKWKAGEQRKNLQGNPLVGVAPYHQSYCCFDLEHPPNMELTDFLKYWNSNMLKFKNFLNHIYVTGGRLEYFIGWYSGKNSGEVFDVSLLQELAELKIDLAIDFYCDNYRG